MNKLTLTRTGPGIFALADRLKELQKTDVLVGIPQEKNARKGEPIGNAALMYIHTHGSPANNIPARPVIEPALQAQPTKDLIAIELKQAGQAIFNSDAVRALQHLRKAGMLGANAARQWFFDPRNNWLPLKPATIKAKHSSQPLIDTGALRGSLTYVVRQEK